MGRIVDGFGNDPAKEISLGIGSGGSSQLVSLSTASVSSAAIHSDTCVIYATANCFVRQGSAPTAVSDGTDQFIPASTFLRLRIDKGNKLGLINAAGASAGAVYITPEG